MLQRYEKILYFHTVFINYFILVDDKREVYRVRKDYFIYSQVVYLSGEKSFFTGKIVHLYYIRNIKSTQSLFMK